VTAQEWGIAAAVAGQLACLGFVAWEARRAARAVVAVAQDAAAFLKPPTRPGAVEVQAFEDELLREPRCTGVAARWCPVHGDCTCPYTEQELEAAGESGYEDPECPLHGRASDHAEEPEPPITGPVQVGERLVADHGVVRVVRVEGRGAELWIKVQEVAP
jgi:hypothetical protein